MIDDWGTRPGTIAVAFIRQEYGTVAELERSSTWREHRELCDLCCAIHHLGQGGMLRTGADDLDSLQPNLAISNLCDRVSAFQCAVTSNGEPSDLRRVNRSRTPSTSCRVRRACRPLRARRCRTDWTHHRPEYHNLERSGKNGESLSRLLSDRGYRIERFTRYFNTSGFIWAARPTNTQDPQVAPDAALVTPVAAADAFADGVSQGDVYAANEAWRDARDRPRKSSRQRSRRRRL